MATLLGTIGPAIQAAGKVIEDPYLPEVSCQVLRLHNITAGRPSGPPCPTTKATAAELKKGIGLYRAARPLRAWVWARQHPLAAGAIAGGVIGLIWGVGYAMGKKR